MVNQAEEELLQISSEELVRERTDMYYPVGWPRLLAMPQISPAAPVRIAANR